MNKLFLPQKRALLLPPKHHSVSDWDRSAATTYVLDDTQYVSAPRSLKVGGAGAEFALKLFLCREATTQNLPQGRIVTWHRRSAEGYWPGIAFRNQSALGSVSRDNGYELAVRHTGYSLWRYVAAAETFIGSRDLTTNNLTWYQDRITWWNGLTADGEDALTLMLERYLAGEWVQQGDWLYDTANQFKDSETNRCGLRITQHEDHPVWFDDTEIWGPL